MARGNGGGVLALALVLDGVEVQGREAEMLGAGFRGRVDLRREEPLVRPGEDGGVGRRGLEAVVLAGDVEGEVEEGLGAGLDKRREAIKNPSGLVFSFCFRVLWSWGTYAALSALCSPFRSASRSHAPLEYCRR